jgi:hypothetical protein
MECNGFISLDDNKMVVIHSTVFVDEMDLGKNVVNEMDFDDVMDVARIVVEKDVVKNVARIVVEQRDVVKNVATIVARIVEQRDVVKNVATIVANVVWNVDEMVVDQNIVRNIGDDFVKDVRIVVENRDFVKDVVDVE